MSPIAIYHEHPDWFKPLLEELSHRGIPYTRFTPPQHQFAIEEPKPDFSLFFNPMSPSAYLRDGIQGMFYTLYSLKHLATLGLPVFNGSERCTFYTTYIRH